MSDYRIAILPGDGTGREVALEARKIPDTISQNTNIGFEITEIACGGQNYQQTGEEWAEGSFECKAECVVYCGFLECGVETCQARRCSLVVGLETKPFHTGA